MYPLNLPPVQILHLSSQLLWGGLILLLVGLVAAYGLEKQLNVPTLVVHGTADPLLPVMHGVHVAAHIKGSELKLIPGLAHRFQDAFKEPLLAAVLPHLAAHRGDLGLARL